MTQLSPYLRFNGNCREAMSFYKDCLGGELTLTEVGDSPVQSKMSPDARKTIVHSSLRTDGISLFGSDMLGPEGLIRGNAMTLTLDCSSEEAIQTYFAKLAENGKIDHPLHVAFWGGMFGSFVDKFGTEWMLNYEKPQA